MRICRFALLWNVVALLSLGAMVGCDTTEEPTPGPDGGNDPLPESAISFKFDNVNIENAALTLDILPENKDMEYMIFTSAKEYFLVNHIDTRESLVEDDRDFLTGLASGYGMSIRELLQQAGWLAKGDRSGYVATSLYPDTEYVVYCYGVEFDASGNNYSLTTEVNYKVIKTKTPKLTEVTFDIDAKVEGNTVDLTIAPKGYGGYYYFLVVSANDRYYLTKGAEMDDEFIRHYRNGSYDEFRTLINNGTPVSDFCYSGTVTEHLRLEPNTDYMVICYALNGEKVPLMSSMPYIDNFTTGDVAFSDMTFDIKITDITPYNAHLAIKPSTSGEYACAFLATSQLPAADTDMDFMTSIMNFFDPAIFKGEHSETLGPLMPNTEYAVIAFGVENNLPSTELYDIRFTSSVAEEGTISIVDIKLLKLFDAEEVIAIDPSFTEMLEDFECIGIAEAVTSAPTDKLYFWWYEDWMKIEYADELFLEDLLMYDYANNPEVMEMYYSWDEVEYFFAGIAEDENGNLSDIYYGENFEINPDMTSPAEEFFEMINSKKSATTMIFGR